MDWHLQFDTTGDGRLDSNEIHEMIKHLTHEYFCCEWDEIEENPLDHVLPLD